MNRNLIKELYFWNIFSACLMVAGFIGTVIGFLEFHESVGFPTLWILFVPTAIGFLFAIPLAMSSGILNKVDPPIKK